MIRTRAGSAPASGSGAEFRRRSLAMTAQADDAISTIGARTQPERLCARTGRAKS